MRAAIVTQEQTISVEMNDPTIEVRTIAGSTTINVIGGVGPQGATPVRGVDYWTAADVASVTDAAVAAVLAALPVAEEASF